MRYFDEPVGRVKIQTTSKNIQRYYTPKRLIRDLLSNDFFSQNSDFAKVLNFTRPGGMRRVQISCDICTRFARYLYSTKQTWIIKIYIIHILHAFLVFFCGLLSFQTFTLNFNLCLCQLIS